MRYLSKGSTLPLLFCCLGYGCAEPSREDSSHAAKALTSEPDESSRARLFIEECTASAPLEAQISEESMNRFFASIPQQLQERVASSKGENERFLSLAAGEIQARACSHQNASNLPTLVFVMSRMPGVVRAATIDCILDKHAQEDQLVWTTITAWRRAGMPYSSGIERLKKSALDIRTKHRLMSHQALTDDKTSKTGRVVLEANVNL